MTHEEEELRRALTRVDPPDGFADRVMARLARDRRLRARAPDSPFAPRRLVLPLAAAVLAIVVVTAFWYRGVQQRIAAGEEAKRQVLVSLRIAGDKLQLARARVNAEP